MTRFVTRPLMLVLCLSATLAGRAAAEVMEGDHLLLIGTGSSRPYGKVRGIDTYDLDNDGIPENLSLNSNFTRHQGASIFLQYYYHWSPSWALGVIAEDLPIRGDGSRVLSSSDLSAGGFGNYSASVGSRGRSRELIPTARYTLMTYRRINPYLFGGAGVNHFSASVDDGIGGSSGGIISPPPKHFYNATSTGLAATLGAGVQVQLMQYLLAGVEGRWTYCQIDGNTFSFSSWTRFGGYIWIGTKWNAPL